MRLLLWNLIQFIATWLGSVQAPAPPPGPVFQVGTKCIAQWSEDKEWCGSLLLLFFILALVCLLDFSTSCICGNKAWLLRSQCIRYQASIESIREEGGTKFYLVTFTEYGNQEEVVIEALKPLDPPPAAPAPAALPGTAATTAIIIIIIISSSDFLGRHALYIIRRFLPPPH